MITNYFYFTTHLSTELTQSRPATTTAPLKRGGVVVVEVVWNEVLRVFIEAFIVVFMVVFRVIFVVVIWRRIFRGGIIYKSRVVSRNLF